MIHASMGAQICSGWASDLVLVGSMRRTASGHALEKVCHKEISWAAAIAFASIDFGARGTDSTKTGGSSIAEVSAAVAVAVVVVARGRVSEVLDGTSYQVASSFSGGNSSATLSKKCWLATMNG